MTISSRTPEGQPGYCVLCDTYFHLEFSEPGNDAPCPNCGHLIIQSAELLDRFKTFLADRWGIVNDEIDASQKIATLGSDSLEMVEVVMAMEEEFGFSISEDVAIELWTVRDAIRYILEQRRRNNGK